ncbi:hypothetical protein JW826_00305 [Candidatus Woesearchaeota archaeon]|nr:hypothetical protein [Candidatus Woesearchaeota archaeon]
MAEHKKENGFMDAIKGGLSALFQAISSSIFPRIAEGANMIMNNIDDKIILIEKRMFKRIYTLLVIGLGGLFLIFALFFLLTEYAGLSKAVAFFSIGITVFVIGLLLKIREPK